MLKILNQLAIKFPEKFSKINSTVVVNFSKIISTVSKISCIVIVQ